MKRFILVIGAVLMLNCNIFADDNCNTSNTLSDYSIENSRFIAITKNKNNFNIASNGEASCYGYTKTISGYKAMIKAELQKYNLGWKTIKSWSNTGGITAAISQSYYVTKGKYRLKVTHYALNSNGTIIESSTTYSDSIVY